MSKKSEKLYKRWLDNPSDLDSNELREALRFKDEKPVEALAISRRREAQRRDADEREILRAAYLMQGGDEATFNKEWPKMRAESEAARLRVLAQGEREASRRAFRGDF